MSRTNRLESPSAITPAPEQTQVLCGPVLCRLRVWSEAYWAALEPARRPARAHLVAGLGWVVAVPEAVVN